jgi:putative ABC transport system ATP-binding protein
MNERNGRLAYELIDVTKRYGDGATRVEALQGVSLAIRKGEFLVIAGPSGSGKTTLLQLLGALDRPTSGQVLFEGRELSALADSELANLRLGALGFIFQQFNLIPTLSAQQNVEVALAPTGTSGPGRHTRARELLEQVGLGPRRGHLPTQLSGGEQQRVAIARALANEPRVLLADEPTGNLDTSTGEEVLSLLHRLSLELGQTTVLVTHDRTIAEIALRVLRMTDGKIVDESKAAITHGAPR